MKKELSIIIVNYNKYQLTQKCIKSVISNINNIEYEIIVVDNCSTTIISYTQLINKNKNNKNVRILKTIQNKGFGYGNNEGVKASKYENILLLNPDVEVLGDSIEKILDRILSDNNIGVIGCKLLNEDLTLQYSCRRFIPLTKFLLARTPLKRLASNKVINKINSQYLMLDYDHIEEKEVDWLMGSCLMLRKKDFNEVKGFSKEYFMYFEDVDLSYKLKKAGKKILYYPQASMIHLHEQESTKKINKLTYFHFISMYKFYKKFVLN